MIEHWVRRALEYQDDGIDLLLPGQSPLGEVLAAPSAPMLDGIAVCLVDVADGARRPDMAWNRWNRWTAADPRWACHRLDTTGRAITESASQLVRWVTAQREAHHAGTLPLTRGWDCGPLCQ